MCLGADIATPVFACRAFASYLALIFENCSQITALDGHKAANLPGLLVIEFAPVKSVQKQLTPVNSRSISPPSRGARREETLSLRTER